MSAQQFKEEGNAFFKAQNFEKAVEAYSKAIEQNPNDHTFYSNRAACYQSLKEFQNAENDAQKCVEIKPDFVKGYQRLGQAQASQNNNKEALISYNKGLEIDPSNQLIKDGISNLKQGGGGGQDAFIQQAFMKLYSNPKTAAYMQDPDFLQKLSLLQKDPNQFMALSQKDPRLMEAMQAIIGDMGGAGGMGGMPGAPGGMGGMPGGMGGMPGAPGGMGDMGGMGSKMEEEEVFSPKKEEKKEAPKSASSGEAHKVRGNEHYKKKEFNEAITCYDQAIAEDKKELLFYNNKAAAYIELNQLDKALETVEFAIQLANDEGIYEFSRRGKLYSRKGGILQRKGDLNEAIVWLEKSLTEDFQAKVKDELRKVQKQKKEQEAKEYLSPEKAEEANESAKVLFKEGNFPGALKQYDEAIARNPKDAKYFCNRGICYMKLMEFGRAMDDQKKAIEIDPTYVKAHSKKGNVHMAIKEYHKAEECYKEGLNYEPDNQECKDGIMKVQTAIYSGGSSKEDQEQRAKMAMSDPEIQKILMTPEIQNALKELQSNPQAAMKIMQNPTLAPQIQKLIAAGVIKTG